MKNRSRLLNYKGTNQHTRHFRLSHSVKMHLSVYALLTLATVTAIGFGKLHNWELDQKLKVNYAYAFMPQRSYTEPTLNPNLSERDNVISLIKRIWGKKDAYIGLAIARCESGYSIKKPHVANTDNSVDQGVFSINSVHQIPEMLNPVANISYAYSMFIQQGLAPWESSRYCWKGDLN